MIELKNLKITHVSYVRKGANKKQFFLMKSDDDTDFEKEVKLFINKADEEQKLIYGVVYEPDEVDTQGEFAKAEEIEKAAHEFLADNRNIDLQHNFKSDYGTVVESYIAPIDFKIANENVKKGAWILVTKATDDIWDAVKKGEITGYSMGGKASKTIVDDNSLIKAFSTSDDEVKGFFNVLKDFFSKNKETKNNKGDEKMKKEDIQNIQNVIKSSLDEQLKPITDRLDAIEKQYKTDDTTNDDDISKIIADTVSKSIEPINKRLETIEKAKGLSRQQQQDSIKKDNKSIFSGIQI